MEVNLPGSNHIIDRNLIQWTSFGKFHNKPGETRFIKDLSDSHLMRLIPWVKESTLITKDTFVATLEAEVRFRCVNYIFIPDYD